MFGMGLLGIIVMIVCVAALVVPAAIICSRTGKPWIIGVLAIVPGVNLAVLWYIALSDWRDVRGTSPLQR